MRRYYKAVLGTVWSVDVNDGYETAIATCREDEEWAERIAEALNEAERQEVLEEHLLGLLASA